MVRPVASRPLLETFCFCSRRLRDHRRRMRPETHRCDLNQRGELVHHNHPLLLSDRDILLRSSLRSFHNRRIHRRRCHRRHRRSSRRDERTQVNSCVFNVHEDP